MGHCDEWYVETGRKAVKPDPKTCVMKTLNIVSDCLDVGVKHLTAGKVYIAQIYSDRVFGFVWNDVGVPQKVQVHGGCWRIVT